MSNNKTLYINLSHSLALIIKMNKKTDINVLLIKIRNILSFEINPRIHKHSLTCWKDLYFRSGDMYIYYRSALNKVKFGNIQGAISDIDSISANLSLFEVDFNELVRRNDSIQNISHGIIFDLGNIQNQLNNWRLYLQKRLP